MQGHRDTADSRTEACAGGIQAQGRSISAERAICLLAGGKPSRRGFLTAGIAIINIYWLHVYIFYPMFPAQLTPADEGETE
ncbi:sucrase/ferredoxin domain-containing protein [Histoplasma capsulatum G186AR]|uniref:Sucrase/ferredoxin domain-containing protein n=1 Tax=Ajellomyces capsulatus TaxID=5037 RepID=A0A8H7YFB3_AJECA|nr:sucrase/ferredoxin domain-containing protein [Histoplasma capsulatum]QSS72350.1 sucrase/ferredoxin domain-containing protein [Histoplasma capsulatum G186AR]